MRALLSRLPFPLLIGLLVILANSACNKDPYEIGFDLLPPSDTLNVKTTDTCTVEAFSVMEDSVRSDKTASLIMGAMMDPVFGKLVAGFYSHARLSSEAVDFGKNPVLDSLVLMLFHNGYYGDTLTRQNVKVYEISEDLIYDSVHFTNQHIGTYPTILADQDFVPNITDSITVMKDKFAAHLRINLTKQSKYLGQKLLYAPTDALATNSGFIKFFKGLYVASTPVSNKGALLNFDISSGKSRLVVYYHNGDDPNDDSLHYDFPLNQACGRFITIDHNGYLDASPELKRQILVNDTARGAEQLFLQGMGGVRIKLKFPHIKALNKNTIVAINDAVLQLNNFETDTTYGPPPSLTMIRQDSAGRIGYMIDDNEGASYFGGTYDKKKRSYFFRLTQHFQNVLQDAYTSKFDIYIVVNSPIKSLVTPNRIVLNGTNPQLPGDYAKRFQLKMTYTILNKQ